MADAARLVGAALDEEAWDLLVRMVETPSVTGDTAACTQVLLDWAAARDLPHGTLESGAPWVSTLDDPFRAPAGVTHTLLFGHLDTVPGDIPVRTEERDDDLVLHGRGTVDAKGCIAAFAAALSAFSASGDDSAAMTLIAAVDEEGDSASAREAAHRFAARPPERLVIGEPSGSDTVCLGYKGRALVRLQTRAETAHGGAPISTAADRLIGVLGNVREQYGVDRYEDEPDEGWFDVVTAKVLSLSVDNDGLSDRALAMLDVRIPSHVDVDVAIERLRGIAAAGNVDLTVEDALPGIEVDRKDPMVRLLRGAIRRATGASARLVRKTGTADLNILVPEWEGVDAAVYGPGDSRLDHGPNEHILRSEFVRAVDVLIDAFS